MPVQLERETLYQQIWSLPLGQLAARLSVSVVDLKNACQTLQIPVPSHGHWNRVKARTEFAVPPLPKYSGSGSMTVRRVKSKYPVASNAPVVPERHPIQQPATRPPGQSRLIPLKQWAELLLGEHAPHPNTLRNWVNNGRIHPRPRKIGRCWYVKPDAEYRDD